MIFVAGPIFLPIYIPIYLDFTSLLYAFTSNPFNIPIFLRIASTHTSLSDVQFSVSRITHSVLKSKGKLQEMSGEGRPSPSNMEGSSGDGNSRPPNMEGNSGDGNPRPPNMEENSGDGNPRPRSLSVIDREIELNNEAHRLSMARVDLEINRMDAEIAGLIAQVNGPSANTVLSPPSVPIVGAGTNFVDRLPDISLNDLHVDSRTCLICIESYGRTETPENPVRLPCGHVVGRSCISRWLTTSNSCPLCRRVLFSRNRATSEGESSIERLLESIGLAPPYIDVAMEYVDITRQYVEVEMRLDVMRVEEVSPERRRELAELTRVHENLNARLLDVCERLSAVLIRREVGRQRWVWLLLECTWILALKEIF